MHCIDSLRLPAIATKEQIVFHAKFLKSRGFIFVHFAEDSAMAVLSLFYYYSKVALIFALLIKIISFRCHWKLLF